MIIWVIKSDEEEKLGMFNFLKPHLVELIIYYTQSIFGVLCNEKQYIGHILKIKLCNIFQYNIN